MGSLSAKNESEKISRLGTFKDNDEPNRNANISTNFITKMEKFRGVRVPS
jgi:hypothetical protein